MGGKGKGKETLLGEKGKEKSNRVIFEIHSDLTYSYARTHERNETISRLVSAPQNPIHIYIYIYIYVCLCYI